MAVKKPAPRKTAPRAPGSIGTYKGPKPRAYSSLSKADKAKEDDRNTRDSKYTKQRKDAAAGSYDSEGDRKATATVFTPLRIRFTTSYRRTRTLIPPHLIGTCSMRPRTRWSLITSGNRAVPNHPRRSPNCQANNSPTPRLRIPKLRLRSMAVGRVSLPTSGRQSLPTFGTSSPHRTPRAAR